MTHSGSVEFTGGCLCGAVRFSGATSAPDLRACHCSQCRRWSGHVWASFDPASLTVQGDVRWFRSSDKAERGFCPTCGSSLFWRRIGSDKIEVAAGAVDQPTGLRLSGHIYTADKGDYYTIDDGLPQSPAG
ncbi:MAG: GFA family protein [Paracoccus sp. (in: a-proteobacteria)]|uniref:GFA family protein n=1 Tax=Paracoccus sp. TaxID=267 RepID=UPI0026E081B7|nr:GFA family protein [Paracoccus sp. (in: a-proteobacteria)]MDO5631166.1 GFA family protein [Paracoccus sp. (in: a-proteobacteria)]